MFEIVRRDEPVIDLRLASRALPVNGQERRALLRQEAWELGVERVRHNVQMTRSAYAGEQARQAVLVMEQVAIVAEAAARRHPSVAESVAMILDGAGAGQVAYVQEANR